MPLDPSVWGTDSGLLDDFAFHAEDVLFGVNPESDYADVIYLHMRGPAYQNGSLVQDDYTIRLSTGSNWEVVSGGQAVESATGAVRFHARSGCGEFVDRVMQLAATDETLEEVLVSRGGNPTDAATWQDLVFQFELVKHTFTNRETDEETQYYRQLPVAFLGVGADALEAGPVRVLVEPIEVASESALSGSATTPKSLRRAVLKFARSYDDDEMKDFIEDVQDASEFSEADQITEELLVEILDENLIWAESRG